jgi:hypothetical protein
MNIIVADSIHYLHIILVFYVVSGWLITPIEKIHYYILLVIFILLDWNDFDGECILTKLEHYMRDNDNNNPSKALRVGVSEDSNLTINTETGQPEFFRPLFNKLFNLNMTSEEASRLNYFVFVSGILLAFVRMLHHYKIMRLPVPALTF